MSSKLSLFKGALAILKEPILGITVADDTTAVNNLNEHYDSVLNWALEQGLWNFATRTVSIASDPSAEPQFGYSHAIAKPDDYAGRIVQISADDRFYCPLNDYQEEGGLDGYIFCDIDPLYLRYISNGVLYGLNLGEWPWSFARAVEYELAFRVAPLITSMGDNAMDQLEKRKIKALRDARSKDALNQGSMRPPAGRLAQSRAGWHSRRWR